MEVDVGEESGKSLEPKFVRGPADREVQEGKMVRFDARCSGRPYPEVRRLGKDYVYVKSHSLFYMWYVINKGNKYLLYI